MVSLSHHNEGKNGTETLSVKKQKQQQDKSRVSLNRASNAVRDRAKAILRTEIDFVPNAFFAKRSAEKFFDNEEMEIDVTPRTRSKSEGSLPTHLSQLCGTPLLTPEQEVSSFRRMNYSKFRFNRIRSKLNAETATAEQVAEAESTLRQANSVRDLLIRANLRLVVSVARKFVTPQLTFDELFSDGVIALMNAVEKFDYDRGYRFSTYAYYSISRSLYRFIKVQRKNRIHSDVLEQVVEADDDGQSGWNQESWDFVNEELDSMLAQLDQRERWIIRQRYTFDSEGKAPTYKVLAEKLGVCNERVRQLEKRALSKLRNLSDDGRFSDILEALDI
ncbi:sigma-70 family RNA polymerase sigma factor [bacterium]|nr:sigma-70 family RNA polymerase sigma factor [bacterium]